MKKVRCTIVGEPLNHIHQDTKSARLIAVCKRTLKPEHRTKQRMRCVTVKMRPVLEGVFFIRLGSETVVVEHIEGH